MRIFCDIDGTICNTDGNDYRNSEPLYDQIEKINTFYSLGHEIIYWTSRGNTSGKDWYAFTERQLKDWGCKFTELRMNKPSFDIFYDDKAMKL